MQQLQSRPITCNCSVAFVLSLGAAACTNGTVAVDSIVCLQILVKVHNQHSMEMRLLLLERWLMMQDVSCKMQMDAIAEYEL